MPNHRLLTLLEVVEKAEYAEEKIDEVEIKADSTQDELIRRKPPIYHIDDATAENEAAPDLKQDPTVEFTINQLKATFPMTSSTARTSPTHPQRFGMLLWGRSTLFYFVRFLQLVLYQEDFPSHPMQSSGCKHILGRSTSHCSALWSTLDYSIGNAIVTHGTSCSFRRSQSWRLSHSAW